MKKSQGLTLCRSRLDDFTFFAIRYLSAALLLLFTPIGGVAAQPPQASEACLEAMRRCESSTDCIHRLAALQSSCVTNTCQPQCRESAMNLYQNKEGRQLLRSDASCVPGRYELEKCGLLPNKTPKHCSFAKLVCESDLPCNAKWEVFVSECEAETNEGRCSDKCRAHLNATLATRLGAALETCTCTDKDDSRCVQLRENALNACLRGANRTPTHRPGTRPSSSISENDINAGEENEEDVTGPESDQPSEHDSTGGASLSSANAFFTILGTLLFFFSVHNANNLFA